MSSPAFLTHEDQFPLPDASTDGAHGLLAVGGDLSTARLLDAYRNGIFPWFDPGQTILWWSPNPRAVLLPAAYLCSRRLTRKMRNLPALRFTCNTQFAQVVAGCAISGERRGNTWLGEQMCDAYTRLHHLGYCHSFEAWSSDTLLGGVLLIKFAAYVSGETMFSAETDGSKIALAGLCAIMSTWANSLIDCQVSSAHLLRLGVQKMSRDKFITRLRQAATANDCDLRLAASEFKISCFLMQHMTT